MLRRYCLVALISTLAVCCRTAEGAMSEADVSFEDSFVDGDGSTKRERSVSDCKCLFGKCVADVNGTQSCQCLPGFGPRLADPITECERCDCGGKFNCTFAKEGRIFKTWEKTCICPEFYKESSGVCKGDCSNYPCQNGGSCKVQGNGVWCECPSSYKGEFCEIKRPDCHCLNGICEDDAEGKVVCTCPEGYGPLPTDSGTECRKCNCGREASCTFVKEKDFLFIKNWKKHCLCPEGFRDFDGVCKGDCGGQPCKNGGKCHVSNEDISCQCPAPYKGDYCERKRDCTCLDGVCVEGEDGKDECRCPSGYGPLVAEPVTECRKCDCGMDFGCSYNKRGWLFKNGLFKSWKKQCECPEGYKEDSGVCKADCSGTPCKNGGTCFVEKNEVKCECAKGFVGYSCEKLKEPCRCLNGQCKVDSRGEAVCTCPPGFGPRMENPVTECHKCDCGDVFSCRFTKEGKIFKTWEKTCICPEGYREDHGVCKGDCSGFPCKNGGLCRIEGNGIKCDCLKGFTGEFCESHGARRH